ncbi:MAG: response regulator [Spirochaetia bacterium]
MAHDVPLFRNLGSLIRGRMARSSASAASTPSTGPAVSVASASAASAAAKAATAEPFAAVERLAGGVAHDFNNIMLVVRGYAELALGEEDLGPKAKAHLQEVMSALTRATELIGQLLAVGRRASSLLAEIDLNESVSRALEQARASQPAGVQASFVAGAGLPRFLASADQLEKLIGSLITYAAERTGKDGRLFLETGRASQEPARAGAAFGASPFAERVMLRLSAPDAEVPDDEHGHMFEPFYVSPSTGRRMGLGMAAARGAISLLGGDISTRKPSEGGIEFVITLPARKENPLTPKLSNGGTILLAEDDVGVRDLASRVLGKEGYRVLAARDGEEAVRLFEQNRERIRIAILDDVMPKLSGRSVLERIRASSPSLPVILCTGYAWGDQESVARPGREEILAKPYEPRDLLRFVRRVLGNGG